ncbi:MAG: PEP-CTERM sorting domain-containing protein [Rhodocyclaceae bacterium]|nr:PEP-CTERM sorting domain-containing protein [Rhodocyclaceae bacterium]
MKKCLISVLLGLSSISAGAVPLTFTNEGVEGQTTVFRAALSGSGLTQIGSVSITDSNSGSGGSPGIFSGFDLDFVFLDLDGSYATPGDRVYGSVFAFTTGVIRATVAPNFLPTLLHPGPTSGSLALNTIDAAHATLNTRDGSYPAGFNADNVSGWLTLGDGGSLGVGFASPVSLSGTEALFVGEVGTGVGELVNAASVNASETTIPEPASLALLGLGLAGLGFSRRKSAQA